MNTQRLPHPRHIFHCAPLIMLAVSAVFAISSVSVPVSVDDIEAFCGTRSVKLVFVTGRAPTSSQLHYIDFSESSGSQHTVHDMTYTTGAALPAVSPDGNWVAFTEGAAHDGRNSNPSTIWLREIAESAYAKLIVQDSGYVPRFKLDETNPTVLFSTRGSHNDPSLGCGRVLTRTWYPDGDSMGSFTEVYDGGSWYSGLSRDGRWLGLAQNAGAYLLDIASPGEEPIRLHSLTFKDSAGSDSSVYLQACNASISPGNEFPGVLMYLDMGTDMFGTTSWHHPVYDRWGFHDLLFLSGHDGTVLRALWVPGRNDTVAATTETPPGAVVDREWSDAEWSNHPWIAVAGITVKRLSRDGARITRSSRKEALYLVDLRDSSYLRIVEVADTSLSDTTSLQWPALWIELPDTFVEDTAWLGTVPGTIHTAKTVARIPHFRIAGNCVVGTGSIARVTVFDPSGRIRFLRIPAGSPPGAHPPVPLPMPVPGYYAVRVRDSAGTAHDLPWLCGNTRNTR